MNTVERILHWVNRNGIPLDVYYGEDMFVRVIDLTDVLTSLSAERCVWGVEPHRDFPGLSLYYPKDHADKKTFGFYKEAFDDLTTCPYCGKPIEIKEADNG